jgi:hypothetical protein
MTRLRLKYVNVVRKNGGRIYHYFRRPGFARVPLPGLPGSAEFMEAYQAALAGAPKLEIGASRTIPGTVNAAIAAFYKSHKFTKPSPRRPIGTSSRRSAPRTVTSASPPWNAGTL